MIQLLNAGVTYPGNIVALKDISTEIEKGEFVFIVGSSGAGKSTLFRLLIREVLPTSGQVLVHGRDVSRMKKREIPLLRRSIGVVFQDFRLLEDRTVYENLAFALRVIGVGEKEIARRIPEVLEMVGLRDKAQSYPLRLSGGEQQRVSIARAIINRPLLLVADEPTGNLDLQNSNEVMKIFQQINLRGTTVVVATHALNLIKRYPYRILELADGCLVGDRPKGEVRFETE